MNTRTYYAAVCITCIMSYYACVIISVGYCISNENRTRYDNDETKIKLIIDTISIFDTRKLSFRICMKTRGCKGYPTLVIVDLNRASG